MTRIFVTGATGTIGSELVRALGKHAGLDVTVGMRDPGRAPKGTTGVRFDWADPKTFGPALEGVERVFLLTPFMADFEAPSRGLIEAARGAGARFIVKLSARGLSEDVPFDAGRQHARLEKALAAGPTPWALVKPTFFMDNVLKFQRGPVLEQGAFYGASGGQPVTYVSSRDVGEVAAAILASPEKYKNRGYELTGPAGVTDAQVAELLSRKIGRAVRFVDLELDAYKGALESQGTPAWQVEALVALEGVKRNGWASDTTSTISEVLGRPAESYASFLERAELG
ncbi:MAG: NmrA family NAD(P)-binding protein [Polyangiaceae bacterium]